MEEKVVNKLNGSTNLVSKKDIEKRKLLQNIHVYSIMKSVPGINKMRTLLSYLTAGNCLGRPLILLSDIVDFKSKEIPVLVVQKTKNV